MAATSPASVCTLILPNGKRCGSLALRGKRFCYHHCGKPLDHTRDCRLAYRLDRLSKRLDAMNAAELLLALHQQLNTLPKTLSRFPELYLTLTSILSRMEEITYLESITPTLAKRNQKVVLRLKPTPVQSGTYVNAPAESGICARLKGPSSSNQ